jgi:hypothetical protein
MKTVYILTEGDYSAYHIIGVYSTKELAEKVQFVYDDSIIEEFALDDVPDYPPGMKGWFVRIIDGKPDELCSHQTTPECATIPSENEYKYYTGETGYFVYCWAVDKEHAEKIALDKYYQHQAQKAGIA